MIPTDIETQVQWRVRHLTPDGSKELTRHGTEAQVRTIAERMAGSTVEARLINVGEWDDPAVTEAAELAGDDDE